MTPIQNLAHRIATAPFLDQINAVGWGNQINLTKKQSVSLYREIRAKQAMRKVDQGMPTGLPRWMTRKQTPLCNSWARRVFETAYLECGYRQSYHGAEFSVSHGIGTMIWVDTKQAWPTQLGLKASYSKSPVSYSVTRLQVGDDYLAIPRDLRVVDGLLTLSATPDPIHLGAYAARWVRQGRGFAVVVESGWLVLDRGRWTHSKRKPAIAARLTARREVLPRETWVSLPEALEINPRVTLRAARRAGNCLPGCQDWAERHLQGSLKGLPARVLYSIATAANDRVALVEVAIRYAATELKAKRAAKGRAA